LPWCRNVMYSSTKSGRADNADISCEPVPALIVTDFPQLRRYFKTDSAVCESLASNRHATTDPMSVVLVRWSFAGNKDRRWTCRQISATHACCDACRHSLTRPITSIASIRDCPSELAA